MSAMCECGFLGFVDGLEDEPMKRSSDDPPPPHSRTTGLLKPEEGVDYT